jgi:hypothetical protein
LIGLVSINKAKYSYVAFHRWLYAIYFAAFMFKRAKAGTQTQKQM